jgi:hypothetical protein
MAKVNFSRISMKDIEGNVLTANFRKELGNQLYMQGRDIEECELGKKIYFTPDDEATELDDKEVAIVRKAVQGYSYVARTAIEQALG